MDAKKTLSERLGILVEQKQDKDYTLNLVKQCEAMGINYQTFQHYYKGISSCSIDNLIKIADYYNTSCDYLLGRAKDKTRSPEAQDVEKITGLSGKSVETLMEKDIAIIDNSDDCEKSVMKIEKARRAVLIKVLDLLIEDYADNYRDPLLGSEHSVLRGIIDFLNIDPSKFDDSEFFVDRDTKLHKVSANSAISDFKEYDPAFVTSIDMGKLVDIVLADEIKKALINIRSKQTQ